MSGSTMRSIPVTARRAEKPVAPTRSHKRGEISRRTNSGICEFIFVVQSEDNLVSIGASTNPFARLEALRRDWGADLDLVFVGLIKGPIADIRRRVLDSLEDHDCGENWFDVSPEHIVGKLHRAAFRFQGSVTQLQLDEVADLISVPSSMSPEPVAKSPAPVSAKPKSTTDAPASAGPVLGRIRTFFTPTKFKLSALGFLLFFFVIAQLLSVR